MDGDRAARCTPRGVGQPRNLLSVVHGGGEASRHALRGLLGIVDAPHHQNRNAQPGVTESDRLFDRHGRQTATAGVDERRRHRDRAVPVRVGLDHRDHVASGGETTSLGEIRAECGKRDDRFGRSAPCQNPPLPH